VLAEAYKESLPDYPALADLSPDSSLMKVLQSTFREGEDYPKDTNQLTLTSNEQEKFQKLI
jgi:hypothetical protein